MLALKIIGIIIVAYLFGNLSISKFVANKRKVNLSTSDSGNPGATNMLRNAGVVPAITILLFDAVKCIIPCIAAFFLLGGNVIWHHGIFIKVTPQIADIGLYVAATSSVLGHMYPVFRKFKGGKGVACGFGLAIVTQPVLTAILFSIYLVILAVIKIGSVGSLFAAFSFIISDCVLLLVEGYYISFALALAILILIVWAHRSNIKRLIHRKENMVDLNKSVQMDKDYYSNVKKEKAEKINKDHDSN